MLISNPRVGDCKSYFLSFQKGDDLNGKDENDATPILLAALNGYRTIVRYLYEHGGGIHLQSDDTSEPRNWANRIV